MSDPGVTLMAESGRLPNGFTVWDDRPADERIEIDLGGGDYQPVELAPDELLLMPGSLDSDTIMLGLSIADTTLLPDEG